jgi:hypothetical protein
MDSQSEAPFVQAVQPISERLNKGCFCITLDRDALDQALEREMGDADFCATSIRTRPHLFSNTTVFLSDSDTHEMLRIVRAIAAATRLSGYQQAALSWGPEIARHGYGPFGVFMGYDFHLAAEGPKLAEVNTNAGGALLNVLLAKAQSACCAEVEVARNGIEADHFELAVRRMFEQEWARQRTSGKPRRIAIVDDRPGEQYLYPEFVLAQRFFLKHDIEAVIADADELRYDRGTLRVGNQSIDLVYNRLVDFAFDHPQHEALRAAYLDNAVVVTPNPHVHALFADKRNLTLLSDPTALGSWGLPREMLADLGRVPRTVLVTSENAKHLWNARKKML